MIDTPAIEKLLIEFAFESMCAGGSTASLALELEAERRAISLKNAILAAFDARGERIAELEAEVARLVACVEQWQRVNSALLDTWDDDEDYTEVG